MTQAPTPATVGNQPPQGPPAQAPPQAADQPQPPQPPSLPALIDDIVSGVRTLQASAAGYETLIRGYREVQDGQVGNLPVMNWPARLGDQVVEIGTDLACLKPEELNHVLPPLINANGSAMRQSAQDVRDAADALIQMFDQSAQQAQQGV